MCWYSIEVHVDTAKVKHISLYSETPFFFSFTVVITVVLTAIDMLFSRQSFLNVKPSLPSLSPTLSSNCFLPSSVFPTSISSSCFIWKYFSYSRCSFLHSNSLGMYFRSNIENGQIRLYWRQVTVLCCLTLFAYRLSWWKPFMLSCVYLFKRQQLGDKWILMTDLCAIGL